MPRIQDRIFRTLRRCLGLFAVLAVAGFLLQGCGAPAEPSSEMPVASAADAYKLGAGDHVRITVFGQPDLTGEYTVDGGGMLAFPLVGEVHAGGLTASQLQSALVDKLQPQYLRNPSVSAEILTYRPFYIVGEVRAPGSYPYVAGMTVINAVALAGGYTYRAREDDFYITRRGSPGDRKRLTASANAPVLPGDVITVRERYF